MWLGYDQSRYPKRGLPFPKRLNYIDFIDLRKVKKPLFKMNSDSTLIPACNDDRFLAVPGRVVCHDLGVRCDVLRGKLRKLIGLSVNPAKWLHFLQMRETQRSQKVEPFDNGYRTITEKRGGCREIPSWGDRGYKIEAVIRRSIVLTLHTNGMHFFYCKF